MIKDLWLVPYDDGLGTYTFCKRGRSHCDDESCDCVDTATYRMLYYRAREHNGWTRGGRPGDLGWYLAACAAGGALVGGLAVLVVVYWRLL